MSNLRFELKYALRSVASSPIFWICFLIAFMIGLLNAQWSLGVNFPIKQMYAQLNEKDSLINSLSAFGFWLYDSRFIHSTFYFKILPVLVLLPFSGSFLSDSNSHYLEQLITRLGAKSYVRYRVLCCIISALLISCIPMIASQLLVSIKYPYFQPHPEYGIYFGLVSESFMSTLFYSNAWLHLLVSLVMVGGMCSIWSVFVLSCSRFFSNEYLMIFILFLLQLVIENFALSVGGSVPILTIGAYLNIHTALAKNIYVMLLVPLAYMIATAVFLKLEKRMLLERG